MFESQLAVGISDLLQLCLLMDSKYIVKGPMWRRRHCWGCNWGLYSVRRLSLLFNSSLWLDADVNRRIVSMLLNSFTDVDSDSDLYDQALYMSEDERMSWPVWTILCHPTGQELARHDCRNDEWWWWWWWWWQWRGWLKKMKECGTCYVTLSHCVEIEDQITMQRKERYSLKGVRCNNACLPRDYLNRWGRVTKYLNTWAALVRTPAVLSSNTSLHLDGPEITLGNP